MRLKSHDGPLGVRNGNPDILNSPKRLNTVHNSNITTTNNVYNNQRISTNNEDDDLNATLAIQTTNGTNEEIVLNNINNAEVQWCKPARELTNNANNRLYNINNTLAVSLRTNVRHGTASSVCSESSPDDSLLDYEDAHQSSSSVENSPQEEDRGFDLSDTDSEEGNLNTLHRRGIVNPNYPGFQHLAHTLDFSIKGTSDTDDDDYDKLDVNSLNNNNNNDEDPEDTELQNDKIDSVNRLDSVENIQKVFYDKPVFNIPESEDTSVSNSNQPSDDETSPKAPVEDCCGLKEGISCGNIVGNFGEEVQKEFGRIQHECLERAVELDLEEAVEKLTVCNDLEPSAVKYNIEPNVEQPFNKAQVVEKQIFDDTEVVGAMATVAYNYNEKDIKLREAMKVKLSDAFLSNVQDNIPDVKPDLFVKMDVDDRPLKKSNVLRRDSNREIEEKENLAEDMEKFCKEDLTKDDKEKDEDSAVPRKKEKVEPVFVKKRRDYNQQIGSLITIPRRDLAGRNHRDNLNRRSLPLTREKKRTSPEILGGFDVYNIETAMPKIDLEAIESHLRAAREEERRRRTDREEIRRRLAMGNEDDYYGGCDRPGRKPSLQARLQSGMNLQICFMNETASDTESPSSDSECTLGKPKQVKNVPKLAAAVAEKPTAPSRPATLSISQQPHTVQSAPVTETDFFTKQARLQTEARMALAQAKEMARMQMEIERQRLKKSPITEMVRHSLEKVGIPFPEDRRRLSRQILTEMNVAQLQVIVNDLHTQIEILNENLVKFLMDRDDLHMEQDSMLVDIEDLTRFLGAKEQNVKEHGLSLPPNNNLPPPSPAPSSPLAVLNSSVKPHLHRIASFVKK